MEGILTWERLPWNPGSDNFSVTLDKIIQFEPHLVIWKIFLWRVEWQFKDNLRKVPRRVSNKWQTKWLLKKCTHPSLHREGNLCGDVPLGEQMFCFLCRISMILTFHDTDSLELLRVIWYSMSLTMVHSGWERLFSPELQRKNLSQRQNCKTGIAVSMFEDSEDKM